MTMLNGSDPFVYLGPGCPTLYYPRAVAGQSESAPRQQLPSFIVHRRAVQPHAFILPTVRNSSVITSTVDVGTSKRRKKTPVTLTTRGQVGKRKTGHQQPHRQVQNCSVQTDWLLDTRDNFVFVEASQMVSEAVITQDCIGGETDDYSMSDIRFEPSSPSVLPCMGTSGELLEMSLGSENTEIYKEIAFEDEKRSDDQREIMFELLKRNSVAESNNNDVTKYEGDYILGDAEIKTGYVQNVFLGNVPTEPENFLGGDFSEVTNGCDGLDTASYVVSNINDSELDREKVFDMDDDEAGYYDNNMVLVETAITVIEDSDNNNIKIIKLGSTYSSEYFNNVNEEGNIQAKEVVTQIIESLLEKVYLAIGSNPLSVSPKNCSKIKNLKRKTVEFNTSSHKKLRIEETIENIEEFIHDANNNNNTPPVLPQDLFSQDCTTAPPFHSQLNQFPEVDKIGKSVHGSNKLDSLDDDPNCAPKGTDLSSLANKLGDVLLCPVSGLVYCIDKLDVD